MRVPSEGCGRISVKFVLLIKVAECDTVAEGLVVCATRK